ncbi:MULTISPECIES: GGDEF domain-containing protein [unclassified Halomonas]|uniref:sensor domain-containing diguanylate cyclase n=1 Tax=unclassified Halomonas TaxID=2609666 RepID=UPI0020769D53|nr:MULTISPECIES: GGDEF domain-containing protein [unclassified Halomonas]
MPFPLPLPRSKRLHRLTLATTGPRVFAFVHAFGLTVWIARVEGTQWQLILPGVILLIWPGIAYWHATLAKNTKRAEFKNLLFDTLLFGIWCSVLDFYVLGTITLALACLLNNLVVGGPRRMLISALVFTFSALAGALVTGPDFRPYVNVWVDIYQWTGAVVYFMVMGRVTYQQNRQIGRSMRAIEMQNRFFQTLLDLTLLSHHTMTIPALLDQFIDHLRTHFPDYGFAVILHERARPDTVSFAATANLTADDQHQLRTLTADLSAEKTGRTLVRQSDDDATLYLTPMHNRSGLYLGWLIVKAPEGNSGLEQILPLFADQLAGATENKLLQLELTRLAERDALTGLYNRGFFDSALHACIANKERLSGADFAVIVMDIDRLKESNDRYGHEAGDELITCVAQHLQACTRESDILARYGGDEFIFLLPATSLDAAQTLLKRIRSHLAEQQCVLNLPTGPLSFAIELSLGCACSSEAPSQEVLALADERMYADKRANRERCDQR